MQAAICLAWLLYDSFGADVMYGEGVAVCPGVEQDRLRGKLRVLGPPEALRKGQSMIVRLACGALQGVDAFRVDLEADFLRKGMPAFVMVGLAEGAVREAKERVFAAMRSCGFTLPAARITVNLAPADRRKAGSAYDLPLAVALLGAAGVLPAERLEGWFLAGELSLSGAIKPVPGVLPLGMLARNEGAKGIVTAPENASEAALVKGLPAYGPATLDEAVRFLMGECELMPAEPPVSDDDPARGILDFADVKGQEHAKRAIEIAAAGAHNLLLIGRPEAARLCSPSAFRPYSAPRAGRGAGSDQNLQRAGMLGGKGLVSERPFREPHHTVSDVALVGGGAYPRPGEVSLAHRGVLFLDELPEYGKNTLDVLRQPLEGGTVTVSRSAHSVTFPADCMLVAAMNPCPCGYYPDRNQCRCTPGEVQRYLSRISGPILDRMDICTEVPRMEFAGLTGSGKKNGSDSRQLAAQVMEARARQEERYKGMPIRFNSQLGAGDIRIFCRLGLSEQQYMERLFDTLGLSARGYHRILRLARTLADLDGEDQIGKIHLSEAACYRMAAENTGEKQ